MRYWPAGASAGMAPPGEMWSVVTLSPRISSGRAADDVGDSRHGRVEERRAFQIQTGRAPGESRGIGGLQRRPFRPAIRQLTITRPEQHGGQGGVHHGLDLGVGRPQIGQADLGAGGIDRQHTVGDVVQHRPGDRVGDNQRRGRQVGATDGRMQPALEIAVGRDHAEHDQVVRGDLGGDVVGSGPAPPPQVMQP